jgi:ribosome biogenesis protein MAK21
MTRLTKIVLDRFYRTLYESLLDQRLATSSKQVLYLNLLFKALKSDINIPRVKAFIKRIVQITSMHSPGFTCGVLFLLAELTTSRPELKTLWSPSSQPSEYDAHKRDPMHANAETSSLWELSPLLLHFHPTVQLYAENLLHPQPNTTKPDLALHTVKHFLDRFVYRNPKTKGTTRGASIMQPLPGTDTSLVLNVRGAAKTEKAVNSEEWWRQQVDRVKPDEVFFHRFFVGKEEKEVRAMGKKRKRGDDDEELGEDEIWEALVKSSREEGGEGDVDVDGSDDDSVDWSEDDDDEIDDEMVQEMNEGESELEMSQSEDLSVEDLDEDQEDISAEEGDVNDFFDDEAEEVEDDDEMGDVSDEEESSVDSDDADGVDGRFEFGDSASDIVDSDEDAPAVVQETNADRSKKRKLKSLPTFAAAEDYAHMLDD